MTRNKKGFRPVHLLMFALMHVFCCGLVLLFVFGASFSFLESSWPTIAIVIVLILVIGAVWYWKQTCPVCPTEDNSEQRLGHIEPETKVPNRQE